MAISLSKINELITKAESILLKLSPAFENIIYQLEKDILPRLDALIKKSKSEKGSKTAHYEYLFSLLKDIVKSVSDFNPRVKGKTSISTWDLGKIGFGAYSLNGKIDKFKDEVKNDLSISSEIDLELANIALEIHNQLDWNSGLLKLVPIDEISDKFNMDQDEISSNIELIGDAIVKKIHAYLIDHPEAANNPKLAKNLYEYHEKNQTSNNQIAADQRKDKDELIEKHKNPYETYLTSINGLLQNNNELKAEEIISIIEPTALLISQALEDLENDIQDLKNEVIELPRGIVLANENDGTYTIIVERLRDDAIAELDALKLQYEELQAKLSNKQKQLTGESAEQQESKETTITKPKTIEELGEEIAEKTAALAEAEAAKQELDVKIKADDAIITQIHEKEKELEKISDTVKFTNRTLDELNSIKIEMEKDQDEIPFNKINNKQYKLIIDLGFDKGKLDDYSKQQATFDGLLNVIGFEKKEIHSNRSDLINFINSKLSSLEKDLKDGKEKQSAASKGLEKLRNTHGDKRSLNKKIDSDLAVLAKKNELAKALKEELSQLSAELSKLKEAKEAEAQQKQELARKEMVKTYKTQLDNYLQFRKGHYKYKDTFFSSDRTKRELFVKDLKDLLDDYAKTGEVNELHKEIQYGLNNFKTGFRSSSKYGKNLSSILTDLKGKLPPVKDNPMQPAPPQT